MAEEQKNIPYGPGSGLLALLFAAALAASAVSLSLMFSLSKSVSYSAGNLHDRHYEMLTTGSSLILLDARLTMAAHMAAVTGEAGYALEHARLAPELDTAIKKINRLTADPEGSPHTAEINEANLQIMELENRAMRLARSGKGREAAALLSGRDYLDLEKTYTRAVSALLLEFERSLREEDSAARRLLFRKSLYITVSSLVTILGWGLAAFFARRWLSQRGSTDALVAKKEAEYRHFFDSVQEIFYRTDWKGVLTDITPSIRKYSGYTREELLGRPVTDLYLNPEDRKPLLAELLFKGMVEDREVKLRTKDRGVLDVLVNARLRRGPGGLPAGVEGSLRDITARKAAEEQLRRMNRLYTILSLVNEAIVRVRDTQKLYETICRIAVENGGMKFAWIGLPAPNGLIIPAASYGADAGYLQDLRISIDPELPEGRGPSGAAFREGKVIINNDTEKNLFMLPWRDRALKRGFRSSATFPIAGTGVATFYAAETGFFLKDEERLLTSLAEDISYAVNSMRGGEHFPP